MIKNQHSNFKYHQHEITGYYSYNWAEVLSADAFNAFEEAGLDQEDRVRETGRRFRETVLAMGGGEHCHVVRTMSVS